MKSFEWESSSLDGLNQSDHLPSLEEHRTCFDIEVKGFVSLIAIVYLIEQEKQITIWNTSLDQIFLSVLFGWLFSEFV